MVGVERDDPAVRNARTGPRWKSNEVGHLRGGANDPAALDRWRRCEAAFALGRFAAWCVIDRAPARSYRIKEVVYGCSFWQSSHHSSG